MKNSVLTLLLMVTIPCVIGQSYSNQWVVKGDLSQHDIANIARRYGFTFVAKLLDDHYLFVKHNSPKSSKVMARSILKQITLENKVHEVSQQVWQKRSKRQTPFTVNDAQWGSMWYYNGPSIDMGMQSSWTQGYDGTGVTVAIVDDGVDYNHPDLRKNYKSGLDAYDNDLDPMPSIGDSHGTECAGVAVAVKNSLCVIGAAFNSSFKGVRLIGPFGVTDAGENRAFTLPGVDIFTSSWGAQEGNTFDGPKALSRQGLEWGIANGRNKLGAIYITAAGNGGFEDNCNCDGYANSIYTIAITAVTKALEPPGYSEPCAAALASAYSGPGANHDNICTTSPGGNCPCDFTGTSAAAPMAAGILALVLQANSNLTWRDVQYLIVRTSISAGLTYGDFFTNGVGRQVSDTYGYGLLNATGLISQATTWTNVDPHHLCQAGTKSENRDILPNAAKRTIESTITTDGCNFTRTCVNTIEHVQVFVSFYASLRGAVQLTLQSPMGTSSKLLTRRNGDRNPNTQQDWTYMTVQLWGEDPVGTWKLTMSLDRDLTESAKLYRWSLSLHGTGESCTKQTVTTTTLSSVSNHPVHTYTTEEETCTDPTTTSTTDTGSPNSSNDQCEDPDSSQDCTAGCETLCISLIVVFSVLLILIAIVAYIFWKKGYCSKFTSSRRSSDSVEGKTAKVSDSNNAGPKALQNHITPNVICENANTFDLKDKVNNNHTQHVYENAVIESDKI